MLIPEALFGHQNNAKLLFSAQQKRFQTPLFVPLAVLHMPMVQVNFLCYHSGGIATYSLTVYGSKDVVKR
jgi:hypothetical protein